MKKRILTMAIIFIVCFQMANANAKFQSITKTYTNADGSYVTARIQGIRPDDNIGLDQCKYYAYDADGNQITYSWGDFSSIMQNKAGEIVEQYNYHDSRLVYILNEDYQVVGLKSSWNGPIVQTFRYTDHGKMLAYDTNGELVGAYEDVLDFHMSNDMQRSSEYIIDHDLNLIDSDGRYYERDSKGLIKAVYEQDGTISKYDNAGNLQRRYDSSGNLVWTRRIYTVEEAERLSKKTGNKFKLIYK